MNSLYVLNTYYNVVECLYILLFLITLITHYTANDMSKNNGIYNNRNRDLHHKADLFLQCN